MVLPMVYKPQQRLSVFPAAWLPELILILIINQIFNLRGDGILV